MHKKRIQLKNWDKVCLVYILFICIIFQSGTVQAAINTDSIFFQITRGLMLVLSVVFAAQGLLHLDLREYVLFFALSIFLEVIIIVNFLLYSDSWFILQYKVVLFIMFFLVGIWSKKENIRLDDILYNVLICIAYITMFLYIVIELLRLPIPYTILHETGSTVWYRNYFNLFYSYSISFPPRICGFFWEPGVNQIYLNLALLLYFVLKKNNKIQLGLLIVSIILTQSSSGYIVMLAILVFIICRDARVTRDSKLLLKWFIAIGGIVGAGLAFYVKKIQTSGIGDSFSMRSNDLMVGWKLFIKNPIVGRGFYNTDIFSKVSMYGGGNSNGLLTVMYTTGVVGLLFLVFPYIWVCITAKEGENRRASFLFLFFVLAQNFTEPIYSLSIMLYLLARQYAIIGYKKIERGNNEYNII